MAYPDQPNFAGSGDTDAFFEAPTPEGRRAFIMSPATFYNELYRNLVATISGPTIQGIIQVPPAAFASRAPANPTVTTYRVADLRSTGNVLTNVAVAAMYTVLLFTYHGIEDQIPRATHVALADAYWLPEVNINLETMRVAAWVVAGTVDTDLAGVTVMANAIFPDRDIVLTGQIGRVTIVAPGAPVDSVGAISAVPTDTAATAGTGLVAVEHTAAQDRGGLVFGLALAATLGTIALATSQQPAPRRRRRAA